MDTQTDSSIVCNNYGQQKITTLRMWYCCTKLPKDFPFLSSYSLARIHPDMTICPQHKTQKNTKCNTVIQTVLIRLLLERIRFHSFSPNHIRCPHTRKPNRLLVCVTSATPTSWVWCGTRLVCSTAISYSRHQYDRHVASWEERRHD